MVSDNYSASSRRVRRRKGREGEGREEGREMDGGRGVTSSNLSILKSFSSDFSFLFE